MAMVVNPEIQKADLWKDGDVITAEKLNRIVFAGSIEVGDVAGTIKLNITPDDVFDENGAAKSLVIIIDGEQLSNGYSTGFIIADELFFNTSDNTYSVVYGPKTFMTSSRTDYFTLQNENPDE